jgi:hypothetical protein
MVGYALNESMQELGGEGNARGAFSIAAAITAHIKHADWIGVFRVGNEGLYALVKVHDRSIMVDGDLIGSEEEIRSVFINTQTAGSKYDKSYAPAEWGIASTDAYDEKAIQQVLIAAGKVKALRLAPLQRKFPIVPIFMVIVLLVIGGAAWLFVDEVNTKAAKDEAARKSADAERERQATAMAAQQVRPWHGLPVSRDLIRECLAWTYDKRLFMPGGWSMTESECSREGFTARLSRGQYATVGSLLAALPDVAVSADGDLAVFKASYGTKLGNETEAPLKTNEVIREFVGGFQQLGLKVAMREVTGPAPQKGQPEAPKADVKEFAWSAQSKVPPNYLLTVLAKPTVRITRISAKHSADSIDFGIEGAIYAE